MLRKWVLKKNNVILYLSIALYGCGFSSESDKSASFCDQVNRGDDLYKYWIEPKYHDSLLLVIQDCEQTPEVLSARLNLLSLLDKNEEALNLIATLNSSDFKTSYDSISSLNYFKAAMTDDLMVKRKLNSLTMDHISTYLKSNPMDTLALFSYCEIALKVLSKKELYIKLDSMSKQNDLDSVYEFVISSYLPEFLESYENGLKEEKDAVII